MTRPRPRVWTGHASGLCALALAIAACNDVSQFGTGPDEAYCGTIVDGDFVREGFDAKLRARMSLDGNRLDDRPGSLWTSDGFFSATPFRPVPKLANDALSTLTFGEGRDRNLVEAIDPADPAHGPSLLAVVSLMHDGSVELRLLRGAPGLDGSAPPAVDGSPMFGLFPLVRAKLASADCSF